MNSIHISLARSGAAAARRPLLKLTGMAAAAALALGGVALANAAPAFAEEPASATTQDQADQRSQSPAPTTLGASAVNTTLTMSLSNIPKVYGDTTAISSTLTPDGPLITPTMVVVADIYLDGALLGSLPMIYNTVGGFSSFIPWITRIDAGEHTLVAKYAGQAEEPTPALPAESDPVTFTVAQAPTTTTITAAPTSARALSTIDVDAQVSTTVAPGLPAPAGDAMLKADGVTLATVPLDPSGTVKFRGVELPGDATVLEASYSGGPKSNYASSTSAKQRIQVTPIATSTKLTLTKSQARADESIQGQVVVKNLDLTAKHDPQGYLEVFVDGTLDHTVAASADVDPIADNNEVRHDIFVTTAVLGDHDIEVRFVPSQGYSESRSDSVKATVTGIESTVQFELKNPKPTPNHPAVVDVWVGVADASPSSTPDAAAAPASTIAAAKAGDPVNGYVQAFDGKTPIGDPVTLEGGAGQLTLAGLGAGDHDIELRFTPADEGHLAASASLQLTVGTDAEPTTRKSAKTAALAATGGSDALAPALGGLALLGAAGLALAIGRRSRAQA